MSIMNWNILVHSLKVNNFISINIDSAFLKYKLIQYILYVQQNPVLNLFFSINHS